MNYSITSNSTFEYAFGYQISFGLLNALVLICGMLGNAFVLFAMAVRRKETSFGDKLVVAISISDLLCSLAGPTLAFSIIFHTRHGWIYEKFLCYWAPGILLVAIAATSHFMAAMPVYRKWIISEPMTGSITRGRSLIVIGALWLWACCLAAPHTVASVHADRECMKEFSFYRTLWHGFPKEMVYLLTFTIFASALPAVIAAVGYLICRCELRRNEERYTSSVSLWKRYRENQNIVYMFEIITFLSTLISLAYLLLGVVTVRLRRNNGESFAKYEKKLLVLYVASVTLLSAKSILAPLIYYKMHKEIRQSFKLGWSKINRTSLRVFRLTVVRERAPSRRAGPHTDLDRSRATIFTMEDNL